MWLDGQSPSGVAHGSVSRPGSTLLAVMLRASGTYPPGKTSDGAGGILPPAPPRSETRYAAAIALSVRRSPVSMSNTWTCPGTGASTTLSPAIG
jgi:hypothetical protein